MQTFVETEDHALIYVESAGRGRPILLVHGWTMSSRFWVRQVEGLSADFQVVTMDLRAHGRSTKVSHGHTVPDYAGDVRAVIETLDLANVVLVGWSLTGPVVLDYWKRWGADRLGALALVEMTPCAFTPADWNTHRLRGHDYDGLSQSMLSMRQDRTAYGRQFVDGMFHDGRAPKNDGPWMLAEHLKTPTFVAEAAYTDYVSRDYIPVMATVAVPTLVAVGDSPYVTFGPLTGRYVADSIPGARLEVFERSGHLPFYEEPERFNQVLAELAE
jgi:pimeloyl-ACP methyl ester carboxylesterase